MNETLEQLKISGEAPDFLSEEGLATLQDSYLLPNETPKGMYSRVSNAAAEKLNKPELAARFFDIMWRGWLCCATPVLSNLGLPRGLPISCNSISINDSVDGIFLKQLEMAVLSKNGAGVGIYFGRVRGRGASISNNTGHSEGIIPWLKCFDSTTVAVSQGCYDDQTEILTLLGWVKFEDLPHIKNLQVAQITKTKQIEYVAITDYIKYYTTESMYHFTNDDVDLMVTPNHNMVIEKNNQLITLRADEIKLEQQNIFLVSPNSSKYFYPSKFYKELGAKITNIPYTGYAYCVTVPSNMIVVRRNGKVSVSSNSVRRGASATYLPIDHLDIEEYLQMRRPTGDVNRRCMNLNHAVCIPDSFMERLEAKEERAQHLWKEILKTRFETGQPYLFFSDTVNRNNPQCYKDLGLIVETSNLCSEITLATDPDHTFVCCLSSLNLYRYDEWKDTDTVELSIWFLDAVMQEYIDKAKGRVGFEASVRFAEKSRALGLGVLGWHSLLQKRMIAFDSFDAMKLNAEVFKKIRKDADKATRDLAKEYGEPEWCKGYGIRNTHLLALAPTVSNSVIAGSVSPGIEPIAANYYPAKGAKGTFIRQNSHLKAILAERGLDVPETWKEINAASGSVAGIAGLTDQEKEVFLTAREINQFAIIRQAAQRQKWIDQGQSVNLFFSKDVDPKYFHKVHLEAWKAGLKTLYYCRTEAILKGDAVFRQKIEEPKEIECKACEG